MSVVAERPRVTVIPAKAANSLPGRSTAKKLRVAAYCRVSSDKDDQLNSFEVQVEYYTDKISANPDWQMVKVYADEGISGTSLKKRDEFKKMIRACREGRIDLILVKSVSRFGRNIIDVMRTVRALQARGIGIMFEKESIDTRNMNSEMMLAFHSAFSQSESESIRENVRWGIAKAFEQGKVRVGTMYGFAPGPDGETLVDEEQADVIRKIAKWYLDGNSIVQICSLLEQAGIKTPRGKAIWSTSTVLSILTNEKYKGDALLQKTYRPSLFSDKAVKNNGDLPQYYVSECLPHILEPEIFDRIQEEVARRKAKRPTSEKSQTGKYSGKYALSSLLICGRCGSYYRRVTWHRRGKVKVVWRCGSRQDSASNCRESPTLEETSLHESIMGAISQQYINADAVIETTILNISRVLSPDSSGNEFAVRSRIAELTQKKNDLISKCLEENDDGKYDLQFRRIMDEMESLKQQLDGISATAKQQKISDSRLQEITQLLGKFKASDLAYDDLLVRKVVEFIRVKSADTLEITFKDGKALTVPVQPIK